MQLSRFVVAYENVRPGEHVLYSVLEDRYAGIDDATLRAVARWSAGEVPESAEELETQGVLVEDGFLVEGRGEDDARVAAHLDKAREGVPGTMYVTLMPTLQCDLACNYCFQKEHPAFTKMSSPTENATLEWLLRQVDERGLPTLYVHYFGGGPTTRKDYCLRTAGGLSASMQARGCKFGGHFFPDQAASFEALLDRLEKTGVARLLAGVQFRPMVDTQQRSKGTCTGCSEKQETQTLVQLNKSIERRKMAPAAEKGATLENLLGPCELHWKNNYTIDPEGRVYKCPAVAGLPGLEVAQVASSAPEKIAPLLELRPWEKCGDCSYLPVCVGGCLGGNFLKTGRRDEVACKKGMFESSFRENVVHRYLAEFPDPGWTEAT